MAIRVDHTVTPQISRDSDQKQKLYFPETAQEAVSLDVFERAANSVLEIAASGVESLGFGDVADVRGFYLEVDQDCYVRINGSLDNIPLKLPSTTGTAKLFMEADLNAVVIQNLSSTAVLSGVYVVWGDPTP